MIRLITSLVILLSLAVIVIDSVNKDNVCLYTETYNVTVQKFYPKNVTVREFVWCKNFPFRCSAFRTVVKNDTKIEIEEKTRVIEQCCPGYEKSKTGAVECHPVCEQECLNGICIGPNICSCFPGFIGKICEEECPPGSWGLRCSQTCECRHGSSCNPMSGKCTCKPHWTGQLCEIALETTTPSTTTELVQETDPPKISVPETTISIITSTNVDQKIETTTHSIKNDKNTDSVIISSIEATSLSPLNTTVTTSSTPLVMTETTTFTPSTSTVSNILSTPSLNHASTIITSVESHSTEPIITKNNQDITKSTTIKPILVPQTNYDYSTEKIDEKIASVPNVKYQEPSTEVITNIWKLEDIEVFLTEKPKVNISTTKRPTISAEDRSPLLENSIDDILKTIAITESIKTRKESTTPNKKQQKLHKIENKDNVSVISGKKLMDNAEFTTESNSPSELQTIVPEIKKININIDNSTKILTIKKKCKSNNKNGTDMIKKGEEMLDQNMDLKSMISEEELDLDPMMILKLDANTSNVNDTNVVKILKKKCKKKSSIESETAAEKLITTERSIQEYTTSYFIENYVEKVKFGEKIGNVKVATILTIIPGVLLTIALITMIIILTIRYKARKKVVLKCIEMSKMDNRTSIFHYPLPDPPTFQNTNFSLEEDNIKNNKKLNCMSQDFCNQNNAIVDFQYDYPKPTMESFRPSEPSYLEPRRVNNGMNPMSLNNNSIPVGQNNSIDLEDSEMESKPLDGADFPYYDEVPPARNIFEPKDL